MERRRTPQPPPQKHYPIDGKDRVLLLLAWGLGVLLSEVLILWFHHCGLIVPVLVGGWYGVLLWYRGLEGFTSRVNLVLFGAVCLLALSYGLFPNPWFRGWNALALPLLMTVQLFQWSDTPRYPWSSPVMVGERLLLLLEGLFTFGPSLQTVQSLSKCSHRRTAGVLAGLLVSVPLLLVAISLLGTADAFFRYVIAGAVAWVVDHVTVWLLRLVLGLCAIPFLFGLLYILRRPQSRLERPASKRAAVPFTLDPLPPATVLAMLDVLYSFFLAVQSAALFGGASYLGRAGISYAEYARSGFFQLVFVALFNLTVVLVCIHISRPSGRSWQAVRVLASILVGLSGILLVSAAWRMSLYVGAYGLSFKRFLTYWGMVILAVFLAAALLKIWNARFPFFSVIFMASVIGWLLLNYCNVDIIVSQYNVSRFLRSGETVLECSYLKNLSYNALGPLEHLPGNTVTGTGEPLSQLLSEGRERAAREASDWRTWSVSAQLAAGGLSSSSFQSAAGRCWGLVSQAEEGEVCTGQQTAILVCDLHHT
ncbi:MAG: DUF4173 domain-containing protein [Oscillospiraceae bacterium]|nr:DUF4173 domain-containing protein [Oscillospiraceae bacterium]